MTAGERYEVGIDDAAEADLEEIIDYLTERRDRADALAFVDAMIERIDRLSEFPLRGSIPSELEGTGETEVRQIVHGKYRILYEIEEERKVVRVIMIVHGRRDMQTLLRTRLLAPDPPA